MSKSKKISEIKSSVISRSMSLAKLGLNAGIKYATTKITNTPLEDFLHLQSIVIAKEFGELKGSIMKAGQILSMYAEHFFPPETAQVLKSLQSDSPSIEWSVIKKLLSEYLEPQQLDQLEIETEPIGSASMGQVHRAQIKNSEQKIALKVQYPNVENAIESDIIALKKILSISKVLPKGIDLTHIFNEIKIMLRQELDYKNEAQSTQRYYDQLQGDTRYIVPKVYNEFSNEHVLATEFIEGLKPDHLLIENLSQDRRNRIAANFLDLYFKELFVWNFVQTDPHLGNYKIQIDSNGHDKIVLLDFGATKSFSEDFVDSYKKMVKGAITEDRELIINGARGLGFIIDSDSEEYVEKFIEFCTEVVEPFKSKKNYNWKQTDLPKRIIKMAFQFKKFDLRSPPNEILFLDRKTTGVFTFLAVMKADIDARSIIEPYLEMVKH